MMLNLSYWVPEFLNLFTEWSCAPLTANIWVPDEFQRCERGKRPYKSKTTKIKQQNEECRVCQVLAFMPVEAAGQPWCLVDILG